MMKKLFVMLTVLGMAGCATYSELQQKAPLYDGGTTKDVQSYLACVMPRWAETNPTSHLISDGESQVIVIPGDGQFADKTIATLTVTPSGKGSRVQWRDMASRGGAFKNRRDAITSCM